MALGTGSPLQFGWEVQRKNELFEGILAVLPEGQKAHFQSLLLRLQQWLEVAPEIENILSAFDVASLGTLALKFSLQSIINKFFKGLVMIKPPQRVDVARVDVVELAADKDHDVQVISFGISDLFKLFDAVGIRERNSELFSAEQEVLPLELLFEEGCPAFAFLFAKFGSQFFGFGFAVQWVLEGDALLFQKSVIAMQPFLDVGGCCLMGSSVDDQLRPLAFEGLNLSG